MEEEDWPGGLGKEVAGEGESTPVCLRLRGTEADWEIHESARTGGNWQVTTWNWGKTLRAGLGGATQTTAPPRVQQGADNRLRFSQMSFRELDCELDQILDKYFFPAAEQGAAAAGVGLNARTLPRPAAKDAEAR